MGGHLGKTCYIDQNNLGNSYIPAILGRLNIKSRVVP
jgi:hypothetical protein